MSWTLNDLPPAMRRQAVEQMTAAKHNTLAGVGQVDLSSGGERPNAVPRGDANTPAARRASYSQQVVIQWFMEHGIHGPVFEYRFHPTRKWRWDISWPQEKVAIEVQGGIWSNGRHTRGAALLKEWEKLNTAAALGWRILYCQPADICTADMAAMVKAALTE